MSTIELNYFNHYKDSPLECTYTIPLADTKLLIQLEAVLDDRVIQTKVMEKEKAQEKFEDSVASGKAAVMAERKKKDELMIVKLGNLLPG